jgi:hypothetical protein
MLVVDALEVILINTRGDGYDPRSVGLDFLVIVDGAAGDVAPVHETSPREKPIEITFIAKRDYECLSISACQLHQRIANRGLSVWKPRIDGSKWHNDE